MVNPEFLWPQGTGPNPKDAVMKRKGTVVIQQVAIRNPRGNVSNLKGTLPNQKSIVLNH